jgi:hypothetical protein
MIPFFPRISHKKRKESFVTVPNLVRAEKQKGKKENRKIEWHLTVLFPPVGSKEHCRWRLGASSG